jgi:hypothetical protein
MLYSLILTFSLVPTMWQLPNQCLVQGFDKFNLGVKILIIQKHQGKHCHLNLLHLK